MIAEKSLLAQENREVMQRGLGLSFKRRNEITTSLNTMASARLESSFSRLSNFQLTTLAIAVTLSVLSSSVRQELRG